MLDARWRMALVRGRRPTGLLPASTMAREGRLARHPLEINGSPCLDLSKMNRDPRKALWICERRTILPTTKVTTGPRLRAEPGSQPSVPEGCKLSGSSRATTNELGEREGLP